MVDSSVVSVRYDGDSLRDGSMAIEQLAPALFGLAEVFRTANSVLNPKSESPEIKIRATRSGSFSIDLLLESASNVLNFVKNHEAEVSGATALIVLVGKAIDIILKSKGKTPNKVSIQNDGGVHITIGKVEIYAPDESYRLSQDGVFRNAFKKVLGPLLRNDDGIDQFDYNSSSKERVSISRDDAFDIDFESESTVLSQSEDTRFVTISKVCFGSTEQWRVGFGNKNKFPVKMLDKDFQKSVDRGEISFTANDYLKVLLRITQRRSSTGLKDEYEILNVLEHIKHPKQMELDVD